MSQYDSIFINQILKSDNDEWLHHGLTPQMLDVSVRAVYTFITSHYARFAKIPSRTEIRRNFPTFEFLKAKEPMLYYVEQIRKSYRMAKIRGILTDASEAFTQDNLEDTLTVLKNGYGDLFGTATGGPGCANYGDMVRDAPKQIFEDHYLTADYPFGDKILDQDFMGMERGDWALIAGVPASGKSWWLFKLLHNLWSKQGLNVLLLSCELSSKIVTRRLHSITAGVNYKFFRKGRFTPEQRKRLRMASMKKYKGRFDIVCAANHDPAEGRLGSLESVRMKIQQYKPDIIGIDGIYLAADMDEWSKTVKFANDFHFLLQEMKTPAITTSQLKNVADASKPQLRDLAFSSAFQQATDFVFLLSKDEKMRQERKTLVSVGKAREDEDCRAYMLNFNPGADLDLMRLDKQATNPLLDAHSGKKKHK